MVWAQGSESDQRVGPVLIRVLEAVLIGYEQDCCGWSFYHVRRKWGTIPWAIRCTGTFPPPASRTANTVGQWESSSQRNRACAPLEVVGAVYAARHAEQHFLQSTRQRHPCKGEHHHNLLPEFHFHEKFTDTFVHVVSVIMVSSGRYPSLTSAIS
jgi:hypothetical protein